MLLVAGGLILLSSVLPVLQFSGPGVGVLAKGLGITLTSEGSYEADPADLWYWTGGFVILFGVILLVTRVRGLGVLWRILAIVPVLVIGAYAAFWWYFLNDPSRFLADQDQSVGGAIKSGITSLLEGTGAYSITPGLGLILLSAAVVVGVIAVFLPAAKTEKYVPTGQGGQQPYLPYPGQPPYPPQPGMPGAGQQYPTQQYPFPGNQP